MVDPLQELRDSIAQIAETATESQESVVGVAAPLVAGFVFEQVTNFGSLTYYDRDFQIAALRASGDAAARIYNFLCAAHDSSVFTDNGILDTVTEEQIHYFAQLLKVNAAMSGDKSLVTAMSDYIDTLTDKFDDTYLYE